MAQESDILKEKFDKSSQWFLKLSQLGYKYFNEEAIKGFLTDFIPPRNTITWEQYSSPSNWGKYEQLADKTANYVNSIVAIRIQTYNTRKQKFQTVCKNFTGAKELENMALRLKKINKAYRASDVSALFSYANQAKINRVYEDYLKLFQLLNQLVNKECSEIVAPESAQLIAELENFDVEKLKRDIKDITDKDSQYKKEFDLLESNTVRNEKAYRELNDKLYKEMQDQINMCANLKKTYTEKGLIKFYEDEIAPAYEEFKKMQKSEDEFESDYNTRLEDFQRDKIKPLEEKIENENILDTFCEADFKPIFNDISEKTINYLNELKEKNKHLLEPIKEDEDKNKRATEIKNIKKLIIDKIRQEKNDIFMHQFEANSILIKWVLEHFKTNLFDKQHALMVNQVFLNTKHANYGQTAWNKKTSQDGLKSKLEADLIIFHAVLDCLILNLGFNNPNKISQLSLLEGMGKNLKDLQSAPPFTISELKSIQAAYLDYCTLVQKFKEIKHLKLTSEESLGTLKALLWGNEIKINAFKREMKNLTHDDYRKKCQTFFQNKQAILNEVDISYDNLKDKIEQIKVKIIVIRKFIPAIEQLEVESLEAKFLQLENIKDPEQKLKETKMITGLLEVLKKSLDIAVKTHIETKAKDINDAIEKFDKKSMTPGLSSIAILVDQINAHLKPVSLMDKLGDWMGNKSSQSSVVAVKLEAIYLANLNIPQDNDTLESVLKHLKKIEDEVEAQAKNNIINQFNESMKRLQEIKLNNPEPIREKEEVDKRIYQFKKRVLAEINKCVDKPSDDWSNTKYQEVYEKICRIVTMFEYAVCLEKNISIIVAMYQKIHLIREFCADKYELSAADLERYLKDKTLFQDGAVLDRYSEVSVPTLNQKFFTDSKCKEDDFKTFENNMVAFKREAEKKWQFHQKVNRVVMHELSLDKIYDEEINASKKTVNDFIAKWEILESAIKDRQEFLDKLHLLKKEFPENFFTKIIDETTDKEIFQKNQTLTQDLQNKFKNIQQAVEEIKNIQEETIKENEIRELRLESQTLLIPAIKKVNAVILKIQQENINLVATDLDKIDTRRREINIKLGQSEGYKLVQASKCKIIKNCHDNLPYSTIDLNKYTIDQITLECEDYARELESLVQRNLTGAAKAEKDKQDAVKASRDKLIESYNTAKKNYQTMLTNYTKKTDEILSQVDLADVVLEKNVLQIVEIAISEQSSECDINQQIKEYDSSKEKISKNLDKLDNFFAQFLSLQSAQKGFEIETGIKLESVYSIGLSLEQVVDKKKKMFFRKLSEIEEKFKTANVNLDKQHKKLGEYVVMLKLQIESGKASNASTIKKEIETNVAAVGNTKSKVKEWESKLSVKSEIPKSFKGLGAALALIGESDSEALPENSIKIKDVAKVVDEAEYQVRTEELQITDNELSQTIKTCQTQFSGFTLGVGVDSKEAVQNKLDLKTSVPEKSTVLVTQKEQVAKKTIELKKQFSDYDNLRKIDLTLTSASSEDEKISSPEIKNFPQLVVAIEDKKKKLIKDLGEIDEEIARLKIHCKAQQEKLDAAVKEFQDFQKQEVLRQKNQKEKIVINIDIQLPEKPNFTQIAREISQTQEKIIKWEEKIKKLNESKDPLNWKAEIVEEIAVCKVELEKRKEQEKTQADVALSKQINNVVIKVEAYKAKVEYHSVKEAAQEKIDEYREKIKALNQQDANYSAYFQTEVEEANAKIKELEAFQVSQQEESLEALKLRQTTFKQKISQFENQQLENVRKSELAQQAYLAKNKTLEKAKLPAEQKEGKKRYSQAEYAAKLKTVAVQVITQPKKEEMKKEVSKKEEPKKEEPKKEEQIDNKNKERKHKKRKNNVEVEVPKLVQTTPVVFFKPSPTLTVAPASQSDQISTPAPVVIQLSVVNSVEVNHYLKTKPVIHIQHQQQQINNAVEAEVAITNSVKEFKTKLPLDIIADNACNAAFREYQKNTEDLLKQLKPQHWLADLLQSFPASRNFFKLFDRDFNNSDWINQNCSYHLRPANRQKEILVQCKDLEDRVPQLKAYYEVMMLLDKSGLLDQDKKSFKEKADIILNKWNKNTHDFHQLEVEIAQKILAPKPKVKKSKQKNTHQNMPQTTLPTVVSVTNTSPANLANQFSYNARMLQQQSAAAYYQAIKDLELLEFNYSEHQKVYNSSKNHQWNPGAEHRENKTHIYHQIHNNLYKVQKMKEILLSTNKTIYCKDFNKVHFDICVVNESGRVDVRLKGKDTFWNKRDTKLVNDWIIEIKHDLEGDHLQSIRSRLQHSSSIALPAMIKASNQEQKVRVGM
jgi:hypothetical protein